MGRFLIVVSLSVMCGVCMWVREYVGVCKVCMCVRACIGVCRVCK